MITFRLDNNNNLLGGEEFLTLSGGEALAQDIKTRLGLFKGEYPFGNTQGVDYINLLSNNNQKALQSAIILEIKKDGRVSEATIETIKADNGKLTLSVTIKTTEGEVINV